MAKKIKVGFYKAGSNSVELMEIADSLDKFYELIECDVIDIASRSIRGKRYDIIIDDEGRLKEPNTLSAVSLTFGRADILVGNLLFTHSDVAGNTTSITADECAELNERVKLLGALGHSVILMD